MARIRTGYSFRAAAGMLDDVASRLIECNYPALPITDRSSAFGWVKWSKIAKRHGMRPVYGVELAVTDSIHAKKPAVDYWTFIAKDSLAPINDLINLATQQFRYEPLLTYEQACASGVVKIVGHRSLLDHMVGDQDTYLGLSPSVSRGFYRKAAERGLRPVAVSDNKFPRSGDLGYYEIVCGRFASSQTYDQHIQTDEEWACSVARLGLGPSALADALGLRATILAQSTAVMDKATILRPERPAPLIDMCRDGAKRLGVDLLNSVYRDRMERELALIRDKQFEDYFYLVADLCTYARARMIVGPARGSSCGSLVCYLLGITTIDPIPHGLIFERFIDINRDDLPDIDIDFSDQQRHLVFEYASNKFGATRVARLGTVAMFKPRSALQTAGKALSVPKWKTDAVAESLIERSSGDSRALQTLLDTLSSMPSGRKLIEDHPAMIVTSRMEGHPAHASQHAAGIVICQEPIGHYIPVDHRTGATMCDKYDAEDLNFLKIDALGLTQLSVFEDTLEMAKLPRDFLETLPLDDPAAIQVVNDRKFSGIFQFNGIALQNLARQFVCTEFKDLVSITALARPGPLTSGGAGEWVKRRLGQVRVTYPHPIFKPYLEDTLGIVLYQEQVMEIARNIGGLSWGDVTSLRKAMSRSLGKEFFDQYGDPWKAGAIAKGVDPKDAEKVWDDLCAYGAWSFNKSHSVAYGMISYWCCWLKAHFPLEFVAATLSHEDDPDRQIMLLREIVAEGYSYTPVDKDLSTNRWSVGKNMLVGPLSSVKGLGPKMVNEIIGARARGDRISDRAAKLLHDPKTSIDSLFPIRDAFCREMPSPSERNIHTPATDISKIDNMPDNAPILVFCTFKSINPRDENELVIVARRGYEIKDNLTTSLNLQCLDDTGLVFGKVDRWKYPHIGKDIVDRGGPGKSLYAVKGKVRNSNSFRMIKIEQVRYIGRL